MLNTVTLEFEHHIVILNSYIDRRPRWKGPELRYITTFEFKSVRVSQ